MAELHGEAGFIGVAGQEGEQLWTKFLDQIGTLPPDNRIDLSFQKHVLETIPNDQAEPVARSLSAWICSINSSSGFRPTVGIYVAGAGDQGEIIEYRIIDTASVAEKLNLVQRVVALDGTFSKTDFIKSRSTQSNSELSPWKRFMSVISPVYPSIFECPAIRRLTIDEFRCIRGLTSTKREAN
jgi:hypothetical protein